jgi:hypothetical protein
MRAVFTQASVLEKKRKQNEDFTKETILVEEALQNERQSYLSPLVRRLVFLDDDRLSKEGIENTVLESGTLNWDVFTKQLMTGEEDDNSTEITYTRDVHLFPNASVYLRRAIIHNIVPYVENNIANGTPETIYQTYGHLGYILPQIAPLPSIPDFEHVTPENALFLLLVHLYRRGMHQVCFSMGTTYLERSIGNLLTSRFNLKYSRPIKINEMLIMPQLNEILGPNIIFLLRLIIGPIQGMNLRNLMWHGFFSDDEFYNGYAALLLVLIPSIAALPVVKQSYLVESRPLLKGSNYDCPTTPIPFNVDQLLHATYFIPPTQTKLWKEALSLYEQGEHFYSAVLIFPLLEQAMRRLYAFYNQREDKVVSAETETCYVTFEDILSPQLEYGTGRNALFDQLDPEILFALHDLLVWSAGPRIRDKLSHGILNPVGLPKSIMDRTVNVCVELCRRYDYRSERVYVLQAYEPVYHPQTFLFEEISTTSKYLRDFYNEYVQHQRDNIDQTLTALLPKDTKEHVVLLLEQTREYMNTHRSYETPFTLVESEARHINRQVVKHQVPETYADRLGNNISSIEILRKICTGIVTTITTLKEVITKTKEKIEEEKIKGRTKSAKILDKYESNLDSLFLLFLLMMQSVELTFLFIHEPRYELCQNCKLLSDSLPVTILRNQWPKHKVIKKFTDSVIAQLN